jgi:hypothetical protein
MLRSPWSPWETWLRLWVSTYLNTLDDGAIPTNSMETLPISAEL